MLQVQYSGPKVPWGSLNLFTGHPTFQIADTTLSGLLPWGVVFSLSSVAICLTQFSFKVTFGLLFLAVKYHGRRHTVTME
jgi:hypothetical protein